MNCANFGSFNFADPPQFMVKDEKSLNSVDGEFESSQDRSSSESGFEMPPEFPPGATVGDLASHVSSISYDVKLKRKSIVGVRAVNGFDSLDSPVFTEFKSPPCTDGNGPTHTNDQNEPSEGMQNGQSSCDSNSLHPFNEYSAVVSKSLLPLLNAPLKINTHRKTDPSSHSESQIDAQKSNQKLNDIADEPSAPVDEVPSKDPEIYSNSSSDDFDEDFDDFVTFQTAKDLEAAVTEAPISHHPENFEDVEDDEFGGYADFKYSSPPPPPEQQQLKSPTSSLVKSLLAHTETALEAAFTTDRDAGINTYIPSEFSNSDAFRAQLRELWSFSSPETVKSLLSSVAVHPESFNCAHVWNTSLTNSMYLETIGIDLQSTRLFLPNDGRFQLLEPTPVESVAHPVPANSAPSVTPSPTSQKSAPEFEWSTSGTTEPPSVPEAVVTTVSDADLDFFEEMPSKSAAKKRTQISDLEAEFLTSFTLPPPPPPPTSALVVPTLPLSPLVPQHVNETQALQDFEPFLAFSTPQPKNE